MVTIKFKKLSDDAKIPTFAHEGDAGMDFYTPKAFTLKPNESILMPTDLSFEFKLGIFEKMRKFFFGTNYELELRMKSGLAKKYNLVLSNGVGTIDFGYNGNIGALLTNTGEGTIVFAKHDKIMQGIVNELPHVSIETTDKLKMTDRGTGGYGSTGVN